VAKQTLVPLISLDQVRPEQVKWLWHGRIPLGKLTILQGDPGLGKSTLALDIASRVSRNLPMPDDSVSALNEPAAVFLMSAEDGLADTIRPRLDAAGADQERIFAPEEGGQFLVPRDVDLIRDAVEQKNAKFVILDPLAAFLDGSINSWNNQHVRRALTPLSQIAGQTGAAILVLDHLNKRSGIAAIQRGSGSIAFNATARSVLLACKHPQDPEACVVASVKSNLGSPCVSLAYRTVEAANKAVKLEWVGECRYDADELVAGAFEPTNGKILRFAMDFLRERLLLSSALSTVVEAEAQARGISIRTLARARKELGVRSQPIGHQGQWTLSLPLNEFQATRQPESAKLNVGRL
jgi:hypothetical protein